MRTQNKLVQVSIPGPDQPRSGKISAAMPYGIMVAMKSSSVPLDERELVLATGKQGFVLMQDVVSEANWSAQILQQEHFPDRNHSVVPIGQAVTARDWSELQVEGAAHLDASIEDDTAVDTPLSLVAGKWAVWDGDEETPAAGGQIAGYLDAQLTPLVAGNVRIRIRKA